MNPESVPVDVEIILDQSNQQIQIAGELTSKTVMKALSLFNQKCKSLPDWVIDFARVNKVDSTAIALLIELKRSARKLNKTISFNSLPEVLLTIAHLSQVEDLIKNNP